MVVSCFGEPTILDTWDALTLLWVQTPDIHPTKVFLSKFNYQMGTFFYQWQESRSSAKTPKSKRKVTLRLYSIRHCFHVSARLF